MDKEKKPVTVRSFLMGVVVAVVVVGGTYLLVYHFLLGAFRRALPIP